MLRVSFFEALVLIKALTVFLEHNGNDAGAREAKKLRKRVQQVIRTRMDNMY